MVEMLREAVYHQCEVTINYRPSEFFDRRILTRVGEV